MATQHDTVPSSVSSGSGLPLQGSGNQSLDTPTQGDGPEATGGQGPDLTGQRESYHTNVEQSRDSTGAVPATGAETAAEASIQSLIPDTPEENLMLEDNYDEARRDMPSQ